MKTQSLKPVSLYSIAAAALLTVAPALAQTDPATTSTAVDASTAKETKDSGPYISLSGGTQNRGMAIERAGTTRLTFDQGAIFSGALGYRFGGFRLEGEYSRLQNDIKNTIVVGAFNEKAGGDVKLTTLAANVYYDVKLKNPKFLPYLGFGLGRYKSKINALTSPTLETLQTGAGGNVFPAGSFPFDSNSDGSFSFYQLKAGVGYEVARSTVLSLGYRYFRGQRLAFQGTPFGLIEPSGSHNHVFEAGLRYNF